MPLLEIKGLGADIADIKKGIGDLRSVVKEVNSEKNGLITEMRDVRDQLRKHRSDLHFEAETLGNSSSNSSNVPVDRDPEEKPEGEKEELPLGNGEKTVTE